MRYLFYITHPAKYYLFKKVINTLKLKHTVDILINSKDCLEQLIIEAGWDYYNLFPKGRNNANKPSIFKSFIKFLITILKLEYFLLYNKKYNYFITDDSLVVNGWYRNVNY